MIPKSEDMERQFEWSRCACGCHTTYAEKKGALPLRLQDFQDIQEWATENINDIIEGAIKHAVCLEEFPDSEEWDECSCDEEPEEGD